MYKSKSFGTSMCMSTQFMRTKIHLRGRKTHPTQIRFI
eukprot:SAG11_NODE_24437_length_373_cov_0.941606_1_plen_37_part_01